MRSPEIIKLNRLNNRINNIGTREARSKAVLGFLNKVNLNIAQEGNFCRNQLVEIINIEIRTRAVRAIYSKRGIFVAERVFLLRR